MTNRSARFEANQPVQRGNQPELVGIVREARWDPQVESWNYQVQFGAQLRTLPEEALRELVEVKSPWDAMAQGLFSGQKHLISTLTFHRLRHPPARIAHSFATARAHFYPHQFKPLLKFLDHPGKRLLIADDVGLGKTIEAGYILRELDAQQVVERVLVVAPARLGPKWKRELRQRFDEQFEIVKGADLVRQAKRLGQGNEPEPFRWIVSYESIRPEKTRRAIAEVQLQLDVLIADEAHKMRNPETLQHKVGAVLSQCADSTIFLSATPVQNKLEDLWHLLQLLSPQEFESWPVFEGQLRSSGHLLRAQRALGERPPNQADARRSFVAFLGTQAGKLAQKGKFFASVKERIEEDHLDHRDLVELQADLGRLSPIGHIMSRTRKVEALPNKPERKAHWMRVPLTSEERDIYDSVESLCRIAWPGAGDSWGFRMSLMMAYRITASCIPAAIEYFAQKLSDQASMRPFWAELEESELDDWQNITDVTAWTGPTRERLQEIVDKHLRRPPEVDSKLEQLISALKKIWEEDEQASRPHRKVVLFSFFRRTLEYLANILTERRIQNRMIHGGFAIDDREIAIEDFLEKNEIRVLLTSEVGGEGIDLQRASVVFNYDLPWNPMVVEQRIGRVDRIGQEATRIVVLNFVVENSIEEIVLQRLLEKIEIFQSSIGEIDEIVGNEIERITGQALRGELSDEELERVVENRGAALARQIHESKEVLSRVDGLLAADQALIDEIEAVMGARQIPSERELLVFLNQFLAQEFPGCQFPDVAIKKVVNVNLAGSLSSALESSMADLGSKASVFARRITSGPIPITLSREAGYHHIRAELLHLNHPLVRFAVLHVGRELGASPTAFAICLRHSSFPSGRYGFMVALVHIRGFQPVTRLVAIVADWEGESVWIDPNETNPILVEMLEQGGDTISPEVNLKDAEAVKLRLIGGLEKLKSEWDAREDRLDQARREHQHVSRLATLESRVTQAAERLSRLKSSRAQEFAIRMADARSEKARKERDAYRSSPLPKQWGGIEHEEIAVGFLEVDSSK